MKLSTSIRNMGTPRSILAKLKRIKMASSRIKKMKKQGIRSNVTKSTAPGTY